MGRTCTVCQHPKVQEIDARLTKLEPMLRVGKRYGLSETAVRRHKERHLFATLARVAEVRGALQAKDLIGQVDELNSKVKRILSRAEADKDPLLVLRAVRESRETIVVLARLLGEISDATQVTVNILQTPQFIAVRAKIVLALAKFPAARQAVIEALEGE